MKVIAPLRPDVLKSVQEILIEVLSVEPEEVSSPNANFYFDLGGESIDLLDLNFQIEKRWGVKFVAKSFMERVMTLSPSLSTSAINDTLRAEFPVAIGFEIAPADLSDVKSLMTIAFITYMLDNELAARTKAG